jgi:hypothetical protein
MYSDKYARKNKRGRCVVCNKKPMDWVGYDDSYKDGFCERCKEEWIEWAMKNFDIRFAEHSLTFGVRDGYSGCALNKSRAETAIIWKKFMHYKGKGFVFR